MTVFLDEQPKLCATAATHMPYHSSGETYCKAYCFCFFEC